MACPGNKYFSLPELGLFFFIPSNNAYSLNITNKVFIGTCDSVQDKELCPLKTWDCQLLGNCCVVFSRAPLWLLLMWIILYCWLILFDYCYLVYSCPILVGRYTIFIEAKLLDQYLGQKSYNSFISAYDITLSNSNILWKLQIDLQSDLVNWESVYHTKGQNSQYYQGTGRELKGTGNYIWL